MSKSGMRNYIVILTERWKNFFFYLLIKNYILIMYELCNLDHVLGVDSQIRDSGGNRNHDHHC